MDVRTLTLCQLMGFPLSLKLLAGEQNATESLWLLSSPFWVDQEALNMKLPEPPKSAILPLTWKSYPGHSGPGT